jgi:hypothetical protein
MSGEDFVPHRNVPGPARLEKNLQPLVFSLDQRSSSPRPGNGTLRRLQNPQSLPAIFAI